MEWLVERPVPVIGIQPKETGQVVIRSSDVQHPNRMIWLPLGLILVLILGTGAGVWIVQPLRTEVEIITRWIVC